MASGSVPAESGRPSRVKFQLASAAASVVDRRDGSSPSEQTAAEAGRRRPPHAGLAVEFTDRTTTRHGSRRHRQSANQRISESASQRQNRQPVAAVILAVAGRHDE